MIEKLKPITVSSSPQQRFADYLQSRKMRNTEQRQLLLERVFSQHEHFDADQLIDSMPSKGQPGYVSRPTVYRTLNEFVDAGLLRKFELDGRSVFEHDYGYPQHDHFYCTECQQLIEFQSDELLKLRRELADKFAFTVQSHRLIIHGICEPCRKDRRRVKRRVDRI